MTPAPRSGPGHGTAAGPGLNGVQTASYSGCAMTAGRCWCAPGPGVPHDADALHPGTGRPRRGWWRDRSRARADFMPALVRSTGLSRRLRGMR